MIESYTEVAKEKQKGGIIAAFYSAYFSKHEKLSGADLQKVLKEIDKSPKQQKRVMTDEEMYAIAKRLAGA